MCSIQRARSLTGSHPLEESSCGINRERWGGAVLGVHWMVWQEVFKRRPCMIMHACITLDPNRNQKSVSPSLLRITPNSRAAW